MQYTVENLTAQKIDLTLRNSRDESTVQLSLKPRETRQDVEIEESLANKLNGYGAVRFYLPDPAADASQTPAAPSAATAAQAQVKPQPAATRAPAPANAETAAQ